MGYVDAERVTKSTLKRDEDGVIVKVPLNKCLNIKKEECTEEDGNDDSSKTSSQVTKTQLVAGFLHEGTIHTKFNHLKSWVFPGI